MGYAQLHRDIKKTEVRGVNISLKKLPYGFLTYYLARLKEVGEIVGKERLSANTELMGEFIVSGVQSWDLKKEDETPAEISLETLADLMKSFPSFIKEVSAKIMEFNGLLEDEAKKK